ncbi:MAG: hypothetical protein JXA87_09710 [Thermoleophilia bacterium]|nr:hypothetical protein [Thermoleophilia bacterium]
MTPHLRTFNCLGHFQVEAFDPRVAGEVAAKVDSDTYPNPAASLEERGKWTFTNSGGTWVCDKYSEAYEGENYFVFIEALGTGEYKGLKLYGQYHRTLDWNTVLTRPAYSEFIMSGWIEEGVHGSTVTSSAGATKTSVAAGETTTVTGTREEVGEWQDTAFPGIAASYIDSKTGELVLTRYHQTCKLHGDLEGDCEFVCELRFPKGFAGSGASAFTCEGQVTFVGEFKGKSVQWVADVKSSGYYDPADKSAGHSISVHDITGSTGDLPSLRGSITFVDDPGGDEVVYSGELTW